MRNAGSDDGFTLIELMVTVVCITVLSAIAERAAVRVLRRGPARPIRGHRARVEDACAHVPAGREPGRTIARPFFEA